MQNTHLFPMGVDRNYRTPPVMNVDEVKGVCEDIRWRSVLSIYESLTNRRKHAQNDEAADRDDAQ